jgi:hypothetical protein
MLPARSTLPSVLAVTPTGKPGLVYVRVVSDGALTSIERALKDRKSHSTLPDVVTDVADVTVKLLALTLVMVNTPLTAVPDV